MSLLIGSKGIVCLSVTFLVWTIVYYRKNVLLLAVLKILPLPSQWLFGGDYFSMDVEDITGQWLALVHSLRYKKDGYCRGQMINRFYIKIISVSLSAMEKNQVK